MILAQVHYWHRNEVKSVKFINSIKDDDPIDTLISSFLYRSRTEKIDTILAMVKELLQYRVLGTVEELNKKLKN